MASITVPDYAGGSLVNLVAELELRLSGEADSSPLHAELARLVPEAATYVLVLFDGLGLHQLDHPAAAPLRACVVGRLDAPFPTTTTVSLASLATGMAPLRHGLLGYQMWLPDVGKVVNTIHFKTLWGDDIGFEPRPFLPSPNLWERLSGHGVEPITIQPANFQGSNLSEALYRGCRFEGIATIAEWVDATVQLAAVPKRLILAYLPQVDFAAHVHGQASSGYAAAVQTVTTAWEQLCRRLPDGVVAIGTADHGHVDFPRERQIRIAKADHEDREFFGDGRVMFVRGDGAPLEAKLPATWIPLRDMRHWWGPDPPHPKFGERAPDGVLVAEDDALLLHRHSDDRMIGAHGGLTDAERLIPLIVAPGVADDTGSTLFT